MFRPGIWVIGFLVLANMVSGIAVVYATFSTRQLFGELQQLEQRNLELKTEYSQLLLEKSAWGAPGRVEQKARSELHMSEPKDNEIKILEIKRD